MRHRRSLGLPECHGVAVSSMKLVEDLLHRSIILSIKVQNAATAERQFSDGRELSVLKGGFERLYHSGRPEIEAGRSLGVVQCIPWRELDAHLIGFLPGIREKRTG